MSISFDISQFAALAVDTGTEVAVDRYDVNQLIYPQFCEVITPDDVSHPIVGDKSTTMVDGVDFRKRGKGEEFSATTIGQGYTPQGKVWREGAKIAFDFDDLRTMAANPKSFVNAVEEWSTAAVRNCMRDQDRLVAKLFAQSAFSAGLTDLDGEKLDQSFTGNPDSNIGLGYDGVTWANNAHPIKFGSTTYDNYLASTALSQTAIDTAYTLGTSTNAVDERGQKVMIEFDKVMVPAALRGTIGTVLNTERVLSSNNNDISPIAGLNLTPIINPYLDEWSSSAWFLLGRIPAVRVISSGTPVFRQFINEETRALEITAQYHIGVYLRNWRYFINGNGATS